MSQPIFYRLSQTFECRSNYTTMFDYVCLMDFRANVPKKTLLFRTDVTSAGDVPMTDAQIMSHNVGEFLLPAAKL